MFYTDAGRKDQALKYLEKAKALFIEMEKNLDLAICIELCAGYIKMKVISLIVSKTMA